MNGIYLYFVNKHPSSWPLLGLKAKHLDSVRDISMVEIVPMNFISYQKLVKMVKDVHVYYSKGLSYELALENGV